MDASEATASAVAHGQIGRGRRTWSQLWQVPTFFVGFLALLCVAASSPFRAELREGPFAVELRSLREGLRSHQDPAGLVDLAERMLIEVRRHPRREGEVHFLAGSVYCRLAETNPKIDSYQSKAIETLEHALIVGVPEADVPALHHRLGVMLFRRGDDVDRAVQLMAQSIEQGADHPQQSYALLVQAYMSLPAPDVEAALAANQKMIELTDEPETLGTARYLRAELLIRKGKRMDAIKELDRVAGKISRELKTQTRLLQARTAEEEGLYHQAAASWKELLADPDGVPGGQARILLAYGRCKATADPADYPAAAVAWQQALEAGGPAGQAAGLRLGELHLFLSPADPALALKAWTEALRNIRTVKDYQNSYLELTKARELFERACRHFVERRDFENGQQAAELYKKLAAPGLADERWAQAVEAQAQERLKQAGTDKEQLEKVHALFHRAAVAYEEAALKRSEREQIDVCWHSAQCYLAAKDLAHAASALERFVTIAKDEPRLAQAWFLLADTQTALGKKDLARQAYYKCMEFPTTPFAWRARYQLAVDEIDRRNFQHAKEILKQNLTVAGPDMDREAHEKSIYKMAGLLLQMQAFDEAVWYLKEAHRRYPNNPKALDARDRLAECYRMLAEQTQSKVRELEAVKQEGMSPERKAALEQMKSYQERTRRQWLNQAIAVYQSLSDELLSKAAQKSLTYDESILVRKALFRAADLHFDMNDFMSALRRYQRLQQDYARQVESLHACYRIWRCVGVMVESPEQIRLAREAANQSVKSARADLDKMPPESPGFHDTGAWTRDQWLAWLDWVNLQLNPPSAPAVRPNPLAN